MVEIYCFRGEMSQLRPASTLPTGVHIRPLDANARQLLDTSVAWMDQYWDDALGLLWSPGNVADPLYPHLGPAHTVRESAWYALGLFLRHEPGDVERAIHALQTILTYQFDEPGMVYHGTFYRTAEERHPPESPIEWKDYDPNWREFIITTLAIILIEYEHQLSRALVDKIDVALRRAVEGALKRELKATYTNIALMNAFMLCFAGKRLNEPAWIESGEAMAREIHRLFKRHDTFEEYNSPTYYGPDLYALAEWRVYGNSLLRRLGAEMEAALWNDIARFYHAGLRNLCGPFDRSYGMDMRRYVAVLGEWIWLITGQAQAPFPALDRPFAHSADFCFGPCIAMLGAQVPDEPQSHLLNFQGERQIERIISDSPRRVATAWLASDIMIGAEDTNGVKPGSAQFHPVTVFWRVGADEVGWIRLCHTLPLDACASANRLDVNGAGEFYFQICAPGLDANLIQAHHWRLPGLEVQVECNAAYSRVECKHDLVDVYYRAGDRQTISCSLVTRLV
jgi:hypothetical protein